MSRPPPYYMKKRKEKGHLLALKEWRASVLLNPPEMIATFFCLQQQSGVLIQTLISLQAELFTSLNFKLKPRHCCTDYLQGRVLCISKKKNSTILDGLSRGWWSADLKVDVWKLSPMCLGKEVLFIPRVNLVTAANGPDIYRAGSCLWDPWDFVVCPITSAHIFAFISSMFGWLNVLNRRRRQPLRKSCLFDPVNP